MLPHSANMNDNESFDWNKDSFIDIIDIRIHIKIIYCFNREEIMLGDKV